MLNAILTVIHVLISLGLIMVVLMQSGKGGGLAGSIGGSGGMMSGAQMAFGGRGTADILGKATTYLAIAFMVMSLGMSIYKMKTTVGDGGSKLRDMLNQEAPAAQPFDPAAMQQDENIEGPEQAAPVTPQPTTNPVEESDNASDN